jgi:isopenicillin N synthase-like dioxygenase
MTFDAVPLVEVDGVDPDVLTAICHEVGFFVALDHGVDASVVEDVFEVMRAFFALDEHDKRRIDKAQSPQFRGWEPVGSEYTNGRVDVREQVDLWTEWPPTERRDPPYLALLGPNQWIGDDLVSGARAVIDRWLRELAALADRLLDMLSIGLGLDAGHLRRYFGDQPMSLTKLISYPPTPDGGAGVNAHHDTGFITVLAAGPTPGLQVQNPDGDWIDVPIVPDSFVVNLGEMLQAITGNFLVATPHRVITAEPRMSAGYFHGPRSTRSSRRSTSTRASPRRWRRVPVIRAPDSWRAARRPRPAWATWPARTDRPPTANSSGTTSPAATPTTWPATTPQPLLVISCRNSSRTSSRERGLGARFEMAPGPARGLPYAERSAPTGGEELGDQCA